MGLGVHLTGRLPKKGFLPFQRKAGAVLEDIGRAVDAAVTDPVLRRLVAMEHSGGGLRVRLHPGEEDILFSIAKGRIDVQAKSSSAGPGYHVMLVELLEDVGARTGVAWSWQDQGGGEGDQTGYHDHRDFGKLRQAMLEWLAALADHLLRADTDGADSFRICLPVGDGPVGPHFALAPMGELTREWCRGAADGNADSLERAGAAFFTAWYGPDHADFWANCGRYLMLWELSWTRPADENERRLYEAALGCFARARDLDPQIAVPEAELREAWTLLNGADPDRAPPPDGLGYRRRPMERALMGAWKAKLPGYFRCCAEKGDKPSTVYWFGPREVHATSITFSSTPDGATASNFVSRKGAEQPPDSAVRFAPARDWLTGHAAVTKVEDGVRTVQGMLGAGDNLCFVTILHEDTPDGAGWAQGVLESVSCPPPEKAQEPAATPQGNA